MASTSSQKCRQTVPSRSIPRAFTSKEGPCSASRVGSVVVIMGEGLAWPASLLPGQCQLLIGLSESSAIGGQSMLAGLSRLQGNEPVRPHSPLDGFVNLLEQSLPIDP